MCYSAFNRAIMCHFMHNARKFYNKIYIPFPDRGQNVVRKIAAVPEAAILSTMHIIFYHSRRLSLLYHVWRHFIKSHPKFWHFFAIFWRLHLDGMYRRQQ